MSTEQYWIGKDIDLRPVWSDYDSGLGYREKYLQMQAHVIQLEFNVPMSLPLFDHEAIFKTAKGYFHELKQKCLPRSDYEHAGPLFLYEISRGSSIWSFLGELRQLLLFGTTLADEKIIGQQLKNLDAKLTILKKYFGNSAQPEDFRAFMRARTSSEIEDAVQRMLGQGLRRVRVSRRSFKEDTVSARHEMIDLKEIMRNPNAGHNE